MNQLEFFVDLPRFEQAKCAQVEDKDLFFPDNRTQEAERLHQLKAICASCLHSKECLEYAIDKEILTGVWGGTSPQEREQYLSPNTKPLGSVAALIIEYHRKGFPYYEIALQLGTSNGYVEKVLSKYRKATRKGEIQLHQQTKDSINDWQSS